MYFTGEALDTALAVGQNIDDLGPASVRQSLRYLSEAIEESFLGRAAAHDDIVGAINRSLECFSRRFKVASNPEAAVTAAAVAAAAGKPHRSATEPKTRAPRTYPASRHMRKKPIVEGRRCSGAISAAAAMRAG